ncbi:LOG family protein [Lichenifustis flavocetrariae]|uniref:Cytokinin riboside 5'-monophosphate phosphoribohydrolase n=1 Tax=Lichenifustis flavocetrariae TaxID=2949735 RepID=A0AA41YZS7_9HYPH|nr:TIGR00730 family Rossman fold protein [Lichenifustis flavocetrariae]MCW6511139.1 TIGR00730 family Rossman fold protein [Lichenifustis flavocetrariae]
MTSIKTLCVYCGSSAGLEPALYKAAEELGRCMAREGIGLVYGGGNNGLMGAIARTVLAHGGHVTGIIPDFLQRRENMLDGTQEMIVVPDMHTRKRLMFERADAFVALPGGIGTLEELVEQMTWVQLAQHTKPVLIANIAGFWNPLLGLFAHMRDFGFVRQDADIAYLVADKADQILPMILAAHERTVAAGAEQLEITPKL